MSLEGLNKVIWAIWILVVGSCALAAVLDQPLHAMRNSFVGDAISQHRGTVYGSYDWIADWDSLKDLLTPQLFPLSSKILMVGCGTSRLSEELFANGYHDITNVDIDVDTIDTMRQRHHDKVGMGMSWLAADITRCNGFGDESFDIAIDKGTLDALLCSDQASEASPIF